MEKLEGFFGRKAAEYSEKYEENSEERVAAHYGFFEGAKFEHDRLTRWNDPKEIMPEPGKKVLVKCISGEIQTDFYEPELGGFFIEHATYAKVIGWREIQE